jgi:uncharacterized membrane protein (UPF0127 family)
VRADGGNCRLVDRQSGRVVVASLVLATTFWQRLAGWQFRSLPPAGTGLLLAPCSSVHTFGMRFAIDLAFLAADGKLLALRPHVPPWQIVGPVRGARAVLELPSGAAVLHEGQQLAVELADGRRLDALDKPSGGH